MKRTLRLVLLVVLPLALVACGDEAAGDTEGATQATPPTDAYANESPTSDPVGARLEHGLQVVEIEAGPMGYQPREVALQAGVPARLVFTRTVESDCSSRVQIPDFDVPATDLPLDEPVAIEFTPTESGTFTFVCGMDMQTGSIMVQS